MNAFECCPTCGGEGYVGGLVVSDDLDVPTVDERCYRCKGTGAISSSSVSGSHNDGVHSPS